ncbi:hypothetical protein C0989_006340 [Termitomyces sp. Mn162]|nr:hypothetical protein C0989_006340 [Termitomyces sp. Mn162]
MAIESGPIELAQDTHKWLETKGWILAAEPYDCSKLVNILVTAALVPKTPDLKLVALATAFLLDANITDHILDILANTVAVDFLVASNTKHAESTLALKASLAILEGVSTLLGAVASKLVTRPLSLPNMGPSWASVAKAASGLLPPSTNP